MIYQVIVEETHYKALQVEANSRESALELARQAHAAYPLAPGRNVWILTDSDNWLVMEPTREGE